MEKRVNSISDGLCTCVCLGNSWMTSRELFGALLSWLFVSVRVVYSWLNFCYCCFCLARAIDLVHDLGVAQTQVTRKVFIGSLSVCSHHLKAIDEIK